MLSGVTHSPALLPSSSLSKSSGSSRSPGPCSASPPVAQAASSPSSTSSSAAASAAATAAATSAGLAAAATLRSRTAAPSGTAVEPLDAAAAPSWLRDTAGAGLLERAARAAPRRPLLPLLTDTHSSSMSASICADVSAGASSLASTSSALASAASASASASVTAAAVRAAGAKARLPEPAGIQSLSAAAAPTAWEPVSEAACEASGVLSARAGAQSNVAVPPSSWVSAAGLSRTVPPASRCKRNVKAMRSMSFWDKNPKSPVAFANCWTNARSCGSGSLIWSS
mmetsp:Transcript_14564/g.37047  ORF Transcript_14564/g.37047 Transcript_14564/m.37047 type:complete len:284 (-) Transcript_14564:211-1062(-)